MSILQHYGGQDHRKLIVLAQIGSCWGRLRKRIKGEPQITTDGFSCYRFAVNRAFGNSVHFAQQVKQFADGVLLPKSVRRFLPREKRCVGVKTTIRVGNPDPALISTSHIERTNLSVRLFNRRYTRLTMGFSKTLENHRHSVALFIAHFIFCRVHSAHGQTPAQAAGLTDRAWNITDLLSENPPTI